MERIFVNSEFPKDLAKRTRIMAAKHNMSRSEFVRIATEAFLEYLDEGGEMLEHKEYASNPGCEKCKTNPYAKGYCKVCYGRFLRIKKNGH